MASMVERNCKRMNPACIKVESLAEKARQMIQIWTPTKLKAIKPKDVIHDVYHLGRIVGPVVR
jgi:hypothetical protein